MKPNISVFACSIRNHLWMEFLDSLLPTKIPFEVVFGGPLTTFQVRPFIEKYPFLKYVHTSDIPPAQIYESCRRACKGELAHWSCDDASYAPNLLDNVYKFFKTLPPKSVVSIKTREDNLNSELDDHRFFGFNRESPLMCPLGVMDREYLDSMGGFDRRFLCGQWENSAICRVYEDGGKVYKYEDQYISIEHLKKHGRNSKFWKGYAGDREILEKTWAIGEKVEPPLADNSYGVHIKLNGLQPPTIEWPIWIDKRKVSLKSQTGFFPYSNKDLLTVSQCPRVWPPKE